MKALDDDLTEITKNSYKAGCDVVLHCNGKLCDIKNISLCDKSKKKILSLFFE